MMRHKRMWSAAAIGLLFLLVTAIVYSQIELLKDSSPLEWLSPPYASVPAELIDDIDEPNSQFRPPERITSVEFRLKYGKYFEADFQARVAERVSKDLDVDQLRASDLRCNEHSMGTLFIDRQGNVVLAVPYPDVNEFTEGMALVATKELEDYNYSDFGFIDRTGKLAIPPMYDSGLPFREGLAAVEKSEKWGFINHQGEIVIPFQYTRVDSFHEGISVVWPTDKTFQMIDKTGKVLFESDLGRPGNFSEGLCALNGRDGDKDDRLKQAGYLNRDMKQVIQHDAKTDDGWYSRCEEFHEGLAVIHLGSRDHGYINREGKLVIPPKYRIAQSFSEGLAVVSEEQGSLTRYGYIDATGKMVIKAQYLEAGPFHEGLAPVSVAVELKPDAPPASDLGTRWGYIDREGKMVIPPRFESAAGFEKGLAWVTENRLHTGFIHKDGKYCWQVTEASDEYFARLDGSAAARKRQDQSVKLAKLELKLSIQDPFIKVGRKPDFEVELINKGEQAIVIVKPNMSSARGDATPIVRWNPPIQPHTGWCSVVQATSSDQVAVLGPGERMSLSDSLDYCSPVFDKLGKQTVRMELENVPGFIREFFPKSGKIDETVERVRRTTPFRVTSNPLEVEVVESVNYFK